MLRQQLLLGILISQVFICWGQFRVPDQKMAQKVMNSKRLIVELDEENEEIKNKIKTNAKKKKYDYPNSMAEYRKGIEDQNNRMRFMAKYLTFHDNIEFKTTSELASLIDSGEEDFSILTAGTTNWVKHGYTIRLYHSSKLSKYKHFSVDENYGSAEITEIGMTGGSGTDNTGVTFIFKGSQVFTISMPREVATKNNLRLAMMQFNHYIPLSAQEKDYKWKDVSKSRTDKLRKMTLLIPRELLRPNFPESEIGEVYKYPFKVVSLKEHEELMFNTEENYAFIVDFASTNFEEPYVLLAVDGKTGEILRAIFSRHRYKYSKLGLPDWDNDLEVYQDYYNYHKLLTKIAMKHLGISYKYFDQMKAIGFYPYLPPKDKR